MPVWIKMSTSVKPLNPGDLELKRFAVRGVQCVVVRPQCPRGRSPVDEVPADWPSVPSRARGWGAERLGAGMTQEVVAREDVVDLQAVRARVALAHVALQEGLIADRGTPLAISEAQRRRVSTAGLTGVAGLHGEKAAAYTPPQPRGRGLIIRDTPL